MAVLAGVLGFVVACFWWLYFDYVGSSALELSSRTSFYWGYGSSSSTPGSPPRV
jgi:hypothetical protein